ncbi:MAG: N-formylglutamate amidohydrolase [Dehalococcoidales bacterium]|nr:N-formylglutamate amidohydrolase [Dehalococcoidales bacterium]
MELKEMLVVIPHSGILIPCEIPVDSLSNDFPRLTRNVDWYTIWLYNFHDSLGNLSLTFPYCSIILEANRDPEDIDSSVPLKDSFGEPIYRAKHNPGLELRQFLSKKYLRKFHQSIARALRFRTFMLDAHSTITAKGVADNQIELMNYQISPQNGERVQFCPDSFIETYAEELIKRLPGIKVSVNESKYHYVYGHVCGAHSINAATRVGNRVPAILQETNQNLYMNTDRTPNLEAIETLRRVFAEALYEMMITVKRV